MKKTEKQYFSPNQTMGKFTPRKGQFLNHLWLMAKTQSNILNKTKFPSIITDRYGTLLQNNAHVDALFQWDQDIGKQIMSEDLAERHLHYLLVKMKTRGNQENTAEQRSNLKTTPIIKA